MITIILENGKNQIIEKIGSSDNRDYFLKPLNTETYPTLSEISDSDNEIVISEQMPQLIRELENLKLSLNEAQRKQLDEVIRLSRICETNEDYFLIFTPFGSFWKEQS